MIPQDKKLKTRVDNFIESIRKIVSRLWGVPSALIAVIFTIVGLIESAESFSTYFPSLATWVNLNAQVLLIGLVAALGFSTVVLGWYSSGLRKRYALIENSEQANKIILFISPSSGGRWRFLSRAL